MKKSKFSEEQIVKILQEAVTRQFSQAELCRIHAHQSALFLKRTRRRYPHSPLIPSDLHQVWFSLRFSYRELGACPVLND